MSNLPFITLYVQKSGPNHTVTISQSLARTIVKMAANAAGTGNGSDADPDNIPNRQSPADAAACNPHLKTIAREVLKKSLPPFGVTIKHSIYVVDACGSIIHCLDTVEAACAYCAALNWLAGFR